MKTMKNEGLRRKICLLLVCLLAAFALSGCGSKSKDAAQTPETREEADAGENLEQEDADTQEESQGEENTPELSDTVRWFNASYAVLTELNHWDYNMFGGMEATDMNKMVIQQLLEQWWDVTDRDSADETLQWIVTEGHRVGFAEDMQYLESEGIGEVAAEERLSWLLENFNVDEEDAQSYVSSYAIYEEHGPNAIAGWDYCRALNLMSYYYIAGYYTLEEALDLSLEMAQAVQTQFESWDELIDSYMFGYEYWQGDSSQERRDVYEDLKGRSDSPYQVDFKTELAKTW